MPFTFSKVNAVIRAVRLSRQREAETAQELALTNEELRAAISEAKKAWAAADTANRSKAEFLAVMSHELRTPLNSIAGYVDLLEMELHGPLTEAQRADLARVRRSQRHLLAIINDILNFTRLEATEVRFDIIEVPLRALVGDLDDVVDSLARAKSLLYQCNAPSGGIFIRTDPDKLRQILINLLSNAVKFTPEGGMVRVFTSIAGDNVSIHVQDTGPGIPADKQQEIFEPFVQLDRALTRTYEGTGLGLAISRGLARGMGADITVNSELGVGSTFTLTVPIAARRPTPPALPKAMV
jgi:signal transduction histidine kinase